MLQLLKKYIWVPIIFLLFLVGIDIFSELTTFILFSVAIILMIGAFLIQARLIRQVVFYIGLFILSNVLMKSYAFLGFILLILLMLAIFQTRAGNELLWFQEAYLHPFHTKKDYIGVKVVRPQIEQRSLIYKQSLTKQKQNQDVYEWDDINIISFGGDSIIDLGTTLLPEGESVILIRKIFGRTRIIVPHNLGLLLNISLFKGNVLYEQDIFPLLNDNFRWQSNQYSQNNRRIRIIISSMIGDVEVIRL